VAANTAREEDLTMNDSELRSKLDAILEFCRMNFVDIQHLKHLLRRHLKIDDSGLYEKNLDQYLKRLEVNSRLLTKALDKRRRKRSSMPEGDQER
jgi:hypothetical protein